MSNDKLNQDSDNELLNDDELSLEDVLSEDDLDRLQKGEMLDSEQGEMSAKESRKGGTLLWVVGGLVMLLVLIGFVWVALKVLSPASGPRQGPAQFGEAGQFEDYGSHFGNQQAVAQQGATIDSSSAIDGNPGIPGNSWQPGNSWLADPEPNPFEPADSAPVATTANAIDITSGLPMDEAENEPDVLGGLTAEEQMYDQLLSQADKLDVPVEAIRIDHAVIDRQLDAKRIQELQAAVASTRESVSQVSAVVSEVRGAVSQLSDQVAAGQAQNAKLAERVDGLSSAVANLSASQEASQDLTALQARIATAERKAADAEKAAKSAAEIAAKASSARQTAVAERRPAAAQRQPAVAQRQPAPAAPTPPPASAAPEVTKLPPSAPVATVTAPTPASAPAVAAAKPATEEKPFCDATRVSSVWRVMGVNENSAYISRAQDRAGLLLRVGAEIPGFGRVVAFDAPSRSVCTTAGLIKR